MTLATSDSHPAFEGLIGVAQCDITPPPGIYARMWGCAQHDVAEGIHRPLSATAIAFQPPAGGEPLVLVSMDLGWWRTGEDEWFLRSALLEILALAPARLMVHLVHTHAGPAIWSTACEKPGGDAVQPYLRSVRQSLAQIVRAAVGQREPAVLAWSTGRCDLARNRDLPHPDGQVVLCGYNPSVSADDTLLVGRVTNASGLVRATIVNYACHPTSLGGANRLISPDYVGAMRQVVQEFTHGAPCLFLQGASGDLGPRQQYGGDPAVADRNGTQLGHAVVSTLAGMLPHRCVLTFAGPLESGAPLAQWDFFEQHPSRHFEALQLSVRLPLKDMPPAHALAEELRQCRDRTTAERLERALLRRRLAGPGTTLELPVWIWRVGDAFLVGLPAEAYSELQVHLRHRFYDRALVVMNIVNGYLSYLAPAASYCSGAYQAEVSLFQPGCLEQVIQECAGAIERLDAAARGTLP